MYTGGHKRVNKPTIDITSVLRITEVAFASSASLPSNSLRNLLLLTFEVALGGNAASRPTTRMKYLAERRELPTYKLWNNVASCMEKWFGDKRLWLFGNNLPLLPRR